MKALLTILIFVASVFAGETISIDKNFNPTIAKGEILKDSSNLLNINTVINSKDFTQNNTIDLPYFDGTIWTKLELQNHTNNNTSLVFQNLRAGIDFIDVYIFKDNNLVKTIQLGDMRDQALRDLLYKNSAFAFAFEPNSKYTIYTKLSSYGQLYTAWDISMPKEFIYYASLELIAWGVLGGFIIALIIYGASSYLSLKDSTIIIYILNAITMLLLQYSINGLFYQFNIGIDLETLTIVGTWVLPYCVVGLCMLFAIYFFELNKQTKAIYYIFCSLAALSFVFALFFLLGYKNKQILAYSLQTAPIAFVFLFIAFLIGFWGLSKKRAGAIYYILGQGSYLICLTYSGAVIMAYLPLYEYSGFITLIGMVINVTFLSLALSKKIKDIKLENEKNANILAQKARFFSIGQTVGNITHQWKNPINHISSQVVLLDATLNLNKQNVAEKLQEVLPQIKSSIEYMKNSMNDFYDFYSNSGSKTEFNPQKEIGVIIRILDEKIRLNLIAIEIKDYFNSNILGYKNSFLTVIMIVIENAIWQLINNKIINPQIVITLKKDSDFLNIEISDNGGGIKISPISKIFDNLKTSTKEDGCGLGLSIAKQTISDKFNGDIFAQNTNDGAQFTMQFKLQ